MKSKLGIHLIPMHGRPTDIQHIAAIQPRAVKIIDPDVQKISDIYKASPSSLIILRDQPLSEQKDDMKRDPTGTGARHAQEWIAHVATFRQQAKDRGLPFPERVCVVGINEPPVWEALQQTVDYTVAFLHGLESDSGLYGGALNLSVGWPGNHGPDTPVDWAPFEPVYPVIGGRHVLILHEYWDHTGLANGWGWLAGRYTQCPWQVSIIIGECGVDEYVTNPKADYLARGWQANLKPNEYMAQLASYDARLQQDGRIVAALPFTSDYAGREWASFDCEPIYPLWLSYTPAAAPPVQPSKPLPAVAPWGVGVNVQALDNVNVRASAGLDGQLVTTVPAGTHFMLTGGAVMASGLPWWKTAQGWVAQYTPDGLALLTLADDVSTAPVQAWDLIDGLARILRIDPKLARAVLQIESGGRAFGDDGRMVIRFENHIFEKYIDANLFAQHFQYTHAPYQQHLGHRWRIDGDWMDCHTSQAVEWQVFTYARGLNEAGAMQSISMGAAQIMGFNYASVGYSSVQAMFADYSASKEAQIAGFFAFVAGSPTALEALHSGDLVSFAAQYNGEGQAQSYAQLIKEELAK